MNEINFVHVEVCVNKTWIKSCLSSCIVLCVTLNVFQSGQSVTGVSCHSVKKGAAVSNSNNNLKWVKWKMKKWII